jgi:hypothetical protein
VADGGLLLDRGVGWGEDIRKPHNHLLGSEEKIMKYLKQAFSGFGPLLVTLSALGLPTVASGALIDYSAKIIAKSSAGATLGYVQEDPNYWTPLLTPDTNSALIVDFTLNGTSGSQINLTPENSGQGFPYFGLVEGRESTSPDIGAGSFNYLYLDGTNGTAPGVTPQLVGNYFTLSSGISKTSESALWTIDVNALTLIPVWVNTDSSTPTTAIFIQSNHVYGGGDASAFNSRFPAPVTSAALFLEIVSAVPQQQQVLEPASWSTLTLGVLCLAVFRRCRRSHCR